MRLALTSLAVAASLSLTACGGSVSPDSGRVQPSTAIALPAGVKSLDPNYNISVFAHGPSTSSLPDDMTVSADGQSVFVGYQDDQDSAGKPVASGKTTGEVIQYDLNGNLLKTFAVKGHVDGLVTVDSNTIWASSNEDGNPVVSVIKVTAGTVSSYTYNKTLMPQSGGSDGTGGLDDMVMVNGSVYVTLSGEFKTAAHNATPPGPNANPFPVIARLTIDPDGQHFDLDGDSATTTAAAYTLLGNGAAVDKLTGAPRTLNVLDPDSLGLDPAGNVILDDQAGHSLITIGNIGTPQQSVSVLDRTLNGTPFKVDDTRFAPPTGRSFILFTDNDVSNNIYRVDYKGGAFPANQGYSTSGSVTDSLLAMDYSTGKFTTIVAGVPGAHGMRFISN
ncbi:hypothetical protein OKW43_008300 [Paraburkholderia sp. WC7.3g]|uniref:hypothetical protein n=1 Tax=Paraburkholderia sp. WC7.3g TaxID=2991070 RepID=UPI003D24379E